MSARPRGHWLTGSWLGSSWSSRRHGPVGRRRGPGAGRRIYTTTSRSRHSAWFILRGVALQNKVIVCESNAIEIQHLKRSIWPNEWIGFSETATTWCGRSSLLKRKSSKDLFFKNDGTSLGGKCPLHLIHEFTGWGLHWGLFGINFNFLYFLLLFFLQFYSYLIVIAHYRFLSLCLMYVGLFYFIRIAFVITLQCWIEQVFQIEHTALVCEEALSK